MALSTERVGARPRNVIHFAICRRDATTFSSSKGRDARERTTMVASSTRNIQLQAIRQTETYYSFIRGGTKQPQVNHQLPLFLELIVFYV